MAPVASCGTRPNSRKIRTEARSDDSLMTFDFFSTDLSKPDKGVRKGALHHRGETHVLSNHHLIQGLQLKPAAVAGTVSSVDTLKVPALQGPQDEYRVMMVIEINLIRTMYGLLSTFEQLQKV